MIIDNATLVIGAGNYFTAPVGTALPTDLTTPGDVWENIGHTSLEDILTLSSDGGDKNVLGTLQSRQLRSIYEARVDTFSIILQQFDEDSLRLYFGENAPTVEQGLVGNPNKPKPAVRAFMGVFYDGDNIFAIYCPRAEIFRGDDLEFSDTETLSSLPLNITPMSYQQNDWNFAVTPLGDASPIG